jgi:type I restriction-modification system DNA methylase subunit
MSRNRGKQVAFLNSHTKDFIKLLENVKPSKHSYEVFTDWVTMAAAMLYSWKKDESVEQEYLNAAKDYTPEEITKLAELLAITTDALETNPGDFLGEVFTLAELTNDRNGQFFTPYCVSYMMAKMMIGELPTDHVCRISDPACGAGGMIIAGAMILKERGYNYQQDAYFVGQDIDHRCARMAFIQASLLGLSAVIICGNTLTFDTYWQRETIGYHLSGMDYRLRMENMVDSFRKLAVKEKLLNDPKLSEEVMTPEPVLVSDHKEYFQGELF